jgi:hypothetical protein
MTETGLDDSQKLIVAKETVRVLIRENNDLRATVEAVEKLHHPYRVYDGTPGPSRTDCAECDERYPCPTVAALSGQQPKETR